MSRRDYLDMRLTICAAGHGVTVSGIPVPLVCGREPGHDGTHRDAEWPVEWHDQEMAAR